MTTYNLNNTTTITTLVDGKYSKPVHIIPNDDTYDLYVGDTFICYMRGETITVNRYNNANITIHTDNGSEVYLELDRGQLVTGITI